MPGEMLQIGSVTKAAGMVSVRHPDGSSGELNVGNPVYQGDQVQTGADGAVGITLNDKSAFSLGPKGAMQLDELVYDPAAPADGHSTVAALHGAFTAVSGDIAKAAPGAMHIKTPVMTIGVRGTTVAGTAAAEGSQNTVTLMRDGDGNVGQVSISNAGGTQVLSGESHSLQLSSFIQPPPPPVALSAAQIQQLYGSALSAQPVPPAAPPANPPPPAPPAPSGNTGNAAPPQQAPVAADPNAPRFIDAAGIIAAAVEGDKQRAIEAEQGVQTQLQTLSQTVSNQVATSQQEMGELVQDMTIAEQAFMDFLAGLDDLRNSDDLHWGDLPDDFWEELSRINWVFGTPNGEVLYGTDDRDFIFPGGGADTVYAGAGDDTVFAAPDNSYDTFYGGDGLDTLSYGESSAGVNVDLVNGTVSDGSGVDYFHNFEVIIGSEHADTFTASQHADTVFGGGGDDVFNVRLDTADDIFIGGEGTDTISFMEEMQGVELSLNDGVLSYIGDDMRHHMDVVVGFENISGGSGNDILTGDSGANVLKGNGGDDHLTGGGGNDTLYDGTGADILTGGDGDDEIHLSLDGDSDSVRITGSDALSAGHDTITGFEVGTDHIHIDGDVFTGLQSSTVNYGISLATAQAAGTTQIIGVDNNGAVDLYYVTDSGQSYQIATVADTTVSALSLANSVGVL